MITITVLKNPFSHSDKEIHAGEYVPGKTAHEYIQPYIMGLDEFVVSINGDVIEDAKERSVNSGDWLAVCPVVGKSGSDWFRTIFSIGLSIWTSSLAKTWSDQWGEPLGVFGRAANFWAHMAAGAVGAIGGALINHWFPPAKADRPIVDVKSAYNWSNAQTRTGQGNALAVTYGTMRTAGQILAQHVSSDDENQYLNMLLCGGEGPLDGISDIRINDNPISFYKGITVETRLGTNNQPAVANFNDVYHDQNLAYELNTDGTWATTQTEGSAVEGLEITLELPNGLYHVGDNGGLENASVTVQVQYRKAGEENWNYFTTAGITAAKNTTFFRTYRVDKLAPAQYQVRAQCTSKSGTDSRYSTRVFWTQLSGIMYDDFTRPGKALIGVRALATSQLSGGAPVVTWLQTRANIWVWNAGSGQYEQKPAANPAWAAYDMIHRCRKLVNINTGKEEFVVQGAAASRLVYQDFANWAAFCEARKLSFNYIFETANDLWTSLQKPEGVGRGKVIMRGTKFGCVCDAPGEPVQLFTVGNIVTDKFKETFVSLKDRANAIEVSFPNKDKDYEREVITAYADDYDAAATPNITQITLDGATSIEQAYREAKYRLRLNQYLTRTVEHSADIDAIACQINDVVLLAHDVPQWGFSGRLLAATATTLQLDREVTLEPGKGYAVAMQVTNPAAMTAKGAQSIVTVAVQGVTQEVTTDTLTMINPLSTVPLKWDLYSFGETSKVVKPFRVLDISRDQDLRRKITCIEYIEAVYNETTVIPQVNYSAIDATPEVGGLSVAEETYRQKDGTMISNLNVAWNMSRNKLVSGYKVLYSSDNGQTWSEWESGIKRLNTAITGVKTGTTYLVKVCAISYVGVASTGTVTSVYVTGKDVPPTDVAGLSASLEPTNCTKINLSWTPVNDVDLAGYRIREGGAIVENLAQITSYTFTATEDRLHSFTVVAVDNSGNESLNHAAANITPIVCPATPTGFAAFQNGDYVYLYWNKNSATDIAGYEIRQGTIFNNGALVQTGITGTELRVPVNAETKYRFHIKALNNAGNYSEDAASAEVAVYGLTPRNVILSFDELVLQNGIHTNTLFGSSEYTCLTFAGLCSDEKNRMIQCNQVGGTMALRLEGPLDYINDIDVLESFDDLTSAAVPTYGEYLTARKDLGELVKVNLAVDFISSALLSAGNSATLWFRHSRDGINFEDWKTFAPVTLTTQYIDFKVVLESVDQMKFPIEVGTFTIAADVDDVERTGSASITAGGTAVNYGHTFLGGSGPNNTPVFTPTAIGPGLRAEVLSTGLSSAVAKVVNAVTGADAGGTIMYRVKGYGG